jgi:hypothetical protein
MIEVLAAATLLFAASTANGSSAPTASRTADLERMDIRYQFQVTKFDRAIVDDAIGRWRATDPANATDAMRERVPLVIYLKDRRCVVLHLLVPNLGGTPAYCYRLDSEVLVEAYDTVQ